ncbi:MAG TPA: hypothetical protein VN811_06155 [Thermoanaerobaculia bacterium]|nr:hypothetical protein [Thermoanaerobaculia bacterium]
MREQAADPWRCWIRHAPARWPGPDRPWIDVAAGRLGNSDGEPEMLTALLGQRLDDVLYLPPVGPALAGARDRLAAQHSVRGTPVLVQLLPGDPLPQVGSDAANVVVLLDLLPVALGRDPLALGTSADAESQGADTRASLGPAVESSAKASEVIGRRATLKAALWPLLPGCDTDDTADFLAASVALAGIAVLQAAPLELTGRDRRWLGDSMDEASYLRLFHGQALSPLPLARAAVRHGLLPLLPRPLPRPPLLGAGNLRIAGVLTACGELCLLLGEPESRAQALLRAARFAEREGRDLAALAREGNLAVFPWLEGEALQVAAEVAGGDEPRLWRQLLSRLQTA